MRSAGVSYALKLAASYLLYYTGALRLWQSIVLRRRAVVLMYHRVLTEEERRRTASHPALVVSAASFANQMAVLRRHFRVLSIEEFADCIRRRVPFPDSSCLITFDDGWRDNFTNALPILAQHRLPALVFLPVNYIGRQRLFWQEALTHLLTRAVEEARRDPDRDARLRPILTPAGLEPLLAIEGDPRAAVLAAIASRKAASRADTERLVQALADALAVRMADLAAVDGFIDWDEVEAMRRDGVAFGGHGADHLLLTYVSPQEAACEIETAKRVVETRLQPAVPAFCYPNGYFTPEIVRLVADGGYELAFSTNGGHVTCDDDPLTLRRLNVHDAVTGNTPMFLARLLRLW